MIRATLFAIATSVACAAANAADVEAGFPLPEGDYTIRANMVMPHLEEMRRMTTEERVCVTRDRVTALFPVLRQPALRGCAFGYAAQREEAVEYVLVCESARVATGSARLRRRGEIIEGQLAVKMGGKNMTFSQGIRARYVTGCNAG
ncbi:MAG: hypothetical protein AB7O21_10790 [Gammaproteobacteria bacterium]